VRYIVGVPKAESDYLVAFLSAHVSTGTDFSVRFKCVSLLRSAAPLD
jgi:sulfonate dioxygenase